MRDSKKREVERINLSKRQIQFLIHGYDWQYSEMPFATIEDAEEAWKENEEGIIDKCRQGTRPYFWWKERPKLKRKLVSGDPMEFAVEGQVWRFGVPTRFTRHNHGCRFESQYSLLEREGLLRKGEGQSRRDPFDLLDTDPDPYKDE